MSSWLHCEVEAAFFRLLAAFLDFDEEAAELLFSAPFPVEPLEEVVLFGIEVDGLTESRSPCESFSDITLVDVLRSVESRDDDESVPFLLLVETYKL